MAVCKNGVCSWRVQESACFLCKGWRIAEERFGPMKQSHFALVEKKRGTYIIGTSLSFFEMHYFGAGLHSK